MCEKTTNGTWTPPPSEVPLPGALSGKSQTTGSADMCTCCTCGYQWRRGMDGSHLCSENLSKRVLALESAIDEALLHLNTNIDVDGNSMAESDAADCLRSVMPNGKPDPLGKQNNIASGTEPTEQPHDGNRKVQPLVGCTLDGYYYPEIGEELGPHQPNLEYRLESGEWVESGLNFGRLRERFVGFYRVKIPAN